MMVEWEGEHPDEGSIHGWLDGALDAPEAASLEAHVGTCAACATRVAEARGLVAGASRIVGFLDESPAPLLRPAGTSTAGSGGTVWRMLRVTPARAAIAAMLLVGVGITLTRNRVAMESVASATGGSARRPIEQGAMGSTPTVSAPIENPSPMNDGLLGSAIARHLSGEHPVRRMEAAPGASIPVPSASEAVAAAAPDVSAPNRVAAARASIRAQHDSSGAPADRLRVGFNAAAPATAQRMAAAGKAAEQVQIRGVGSAGVGADLAVAGLVAGSPAGLCYRVESSSAGAQWGSVPLPFVVAFESTGTLARVLTASGGVTDSRASLRRIDPDSVVLRLMRIGYDGTLSLSGSGDSRDGVMHSSRSTAALSEVVVTATGVSEPAEDSRSKARVAAPPPAASPAFPPAAAQPRPTSAADRVAPAVPVTAQRVSCPKP